MIINSVKLAEQTHNGREKKYTFHRVIFFSC